MATPRPRRTPISTKNLVPNQRSSASPTPPQTTIPESMVPVIPQPTSAPLGWESAGFSGRGRAPPGAGVSSAIGIGPYQPRVVRVSGSLRGGSGTAPSGAGAGGGGT